LNLSESEHDIVDGVRKAGMEERKVDVLDFSTWEDVANIYDEPAFTKWLKESGVDIEQEKQDFINIGYEDEDFALFMHRTFEAETGA
jgi:hypothetical protein